MAILILAMLCTGAGQDTPPQAGKSPSWAEANFAGTPPRDVSRSKNGRLELENILGSRRFRHGPVIMKFAFSGDGRRVVSLGGDERIKVLEFETGKHVMGWECERAFSIAISRDGKRVATGHSYSLRLWDVETGKELRTIGRPPPDSPSDQYQNVVALAFSPDGNSIISASWRGAYGGVDCLVQSGGPPLITTWDLSGNKKAAWTARERSGILRFSPDASRVAIGIGDKVAVWDVKTGTPLLTKGEPDPPGSRLESNLPGFDRGGRGSVTFSLDGKRVLFQAASRLKTIDISGGNETASVELPDGSVFTGRVSADATRVILATKEGLTVVESATGKRLKDYPLKVHAMGPPFELSPDGRQILHSDDMLFRLIDIETGRELYSHEGPTTEIRVVALSPDGKRVLSGTEDMSFAVWDIASGKLLSMSRRHREVKPADRAKDSTLKIGSDGKYAVSQSEKSAQLWDVETGNKLKSWESASLSFSADGRKLLVGETGKNGLGVSVWDLGTLSQMFTIVDSEPINYAGFTWDGKEVITSTKKKDGYWDTHWDATSGKLLRTSEGITFLPPSAGDPRPRQVQQRHEPSPQYWSSWSPDGKYLLNRGGDSGSELGTNMFVPGQFHLRDVKANKHLVTWEWARPELCCVFGFTADSKRAVLGGTENLVLVDVPSGKELDSIRNDAAANCLAVYPERMLVGNRDGTISVYRISAQEEKPAGAARELKLPTAVHEQKLPDAVKKAQAKLPGSPDDADANLTVGKYFFQLGKSDEALPYFAKGSDLALKALAEKELSKDPDATTLGGEWAEASKKNVPLRQVMMDRAVFWCAKAWIKADDQEKTKLRPILRRVASPPAGFEKAGNKKTESIEGWNVFSEATSSYLDDLFAHEGKRSAKVLPAGKDSKNGFSWVATQNVPAAAGKVYKASAWFFTEGMDADGIFYFEFSDSDGKRLAGGSKPILMDCPFWRKIEMEATAPEGTIRTSLSFWVRSKRGAMWIDDVSNQQDGKELVKNGGLEGK